MKYLTILLFIASTAVAGTRRAGTFPDALAEAKQANTPVAVYIHGSSWHPASKVFTDKIWTSPDLEKYLKNPIVLTNIHIRQSLDKETAKSENTKNKPWNSKTVKSYPAIQVYAPDGFLLKTIQGSDFRSLNSLTEVAKAIDGIATASAKRSILLSEISRARKAKDTSAETAALAALSELPTNSEPKLIDQLKKADPEDSTGLQTKLSFKNWWFVREINGLIKKGEHTEALSRIEKMLTSPVYSPEQRIYIHGARGKVLVAQGKLVQAWEAFQQAYELAPGDPNASAMLEHGRRIAGIPSRRVFPESSELANKDIGRLLSASATFTMSSSAHDVVDNHASLFKGAHRDFAFHTNREKGAHITVDLGGKCVVKALRITNRRSSGDRARSLTVWHSLDGKTWTSAWTAEKTDSAWDILFPSPIKARYFKVGLAPDVTNFLHLRAFDAYGERI